MENWKTENYKKNIKSTHIQSTSVNHSYHLPYMSTCGFYMLLSTYDTAYLHTVLLFNTSSHNVLFQAICCFFSPNCTLGRFSCLLRYKFYSLLGGVNSLLPFLSSSSPFVFSVAITSHRYCHCTVFSQQTLFPPP